MVTALAEHTEKISVDLFDDIAEHLQDEAPLLVEWVSNWIKSLSRGIQAKFDDVYSVCWDSRQDIMDPKIKEQIEKGRKRLCTDLTLLRESQKESYDIMISSEPIVSSMAAVKMEEDL